MQQLHDNFMQDEDFDIKPFLKIPNATARAIKSMHRKYITLRKNK
jgi:hypothetical protein